MMMNPYELEHTKQRQRKMLSFAVLERDLRNAKVPHPPTHKEINLRSLLENAANAALSILL